MKASRDGLALYTMQNGKGEYLFQVREENIFAESGNKTVEWASDPSEIIGDTCLVGRAPGSQKKCYLAVQGFRTQKRLNSETFIDCA
jgi:hypothetical protein